MVINEIFQSVNASIANDKLVICDKTFALPSPGIEGFLSKRFGRNALEISHVKLKKLNEESFEVTGTTDVEVESTFLLLVKQSEKDIMFTFSLTIPKSIICIYEKNYNTTETKKQYIFFMNNPLEDLISMGGNLTEPLSLASILGIALGSKDNPSADFPALSLQNIHLTYGTELSYSKLRECIYFSTETNFNISTNICLQSLGFEIKKRDKLFDLAMHATIKLVGQVLPIVLRYSDSRFLFGLRIPKEGLIFSSIEEIAKLSNSNVSAYLPSAFTQIEVTLYKLSIIFPTNLSKIISFDFSASLGLDWKFFGLEKLRLKEIAVMVSIAEKNSFAISGTLQIGSLSLRLLAQTEDVNKSLVFGGSFIKDSKLYLDDIVNSLADLIGVSNISFPDSFPEIYIENLSFLFDVKQSNIKFSATLVIEKKEDGSIIDKLFQMKANVNVEAKKSGKSYEYTGKFGGYLTIMEQHFTVEYVFGKNSGDIITAKWECTEKDNNPLSLSGLAEFFGVSKLPQELDDLGIACNLIELQYNISKNVLDCTVKSNEYGSIHFIITTDEEKKTQFGLNVNMIKTISLSKLPVVGEGLKLLDQVAIKDINIKFGSKQMSDKGIESGLKLKAALCIVDKQYEFAIDIIKPKEKEVQQFTLYEEGDTEVISADNAKEEITDISGVAKWFKIEKNLGVFSLHRLGVVWENGHLGVALDADLAVNPIKIELIGLGLGFKLSDLSDFSSINYYLSGLGISYNSPSLEIGGTFVVCKGNAENPEDSYDGVVNIKTKVLSITAIGSYQNDSIFAFAILKAQIGGPPAFFVTGLALGFGYNRNLVIPSIDEVQNFPLLKGAFGKSSNQEMIADMKGKYIKPSKGQHFVSAGILFTSFKMIESFALLNVKFGSKLEFALLGLSEINIPQNLPSGTNPIAHAQLALRATFLEETGALEIMAQLTSESYILSKDCKLTGGFAFYIWFAGDHAGDFVITLGGYNRVAYKKPAHYPSVPRLGFSWKITDNLTASGELYFALTPSAIMAGGALNIVYQSGGLRAWMTARADFLIQWKPFHYDISLYIGLGASYRTYVLFGYVTFSLELSVDLHIWGPPFSGKARVTWFIISFTISFGASENKKQYIDWNDFVHSFMPSKQVYAIAVQKGLLTVTKTTDEISIVDPETLEIQINSAMPFTELKQGEENILLKKKTLGVLPMGENKNLVSCLKITIYDEDGELPFDCQPVYTNQPNALWGQSEKGSSLVNDVPTGVKISALESYKFKELPEDRFLDLKEVSENEKIPKYYNWRKPNPIKGPMYDQYDSINYFKNTVTTATISSNRDALIGEFGALGFDLSKGAKLSRLQKTANDVLYENIKLKSLV